MSRFVVGIDLGTTNTALAFVDAEISPENPDEAIVATMPVEQVVAAGAVDARASLPSAVYVSGGTELPAGSLNLPWRAEEKVVVGHFAREQGAKVPTRFVHSSKSWLCHGGIDREAKSLPLNSPDEDAKLSPVDVSTLILKHLQESWNHMMAEEDATLNLADQEVTLCVPASFDAGARNLTVQAAQAAGFHNLHLLEEPQAAIYAWIEATGSNWRDLVKKDDLILVVDVGGGTTDFSLIAVTEDDGQLELRRVAVGDHILLGGDNMDLAIAYGVAQRLQEEKGKKLDAWQMSALVQQCRMAKEELLTNPDKESVPLTILGRGSSVIGGTIKTELPRAGLDQFLLEGFFPRVASDARPQMAKRSGFRSAGLPYAADPGITRHMARFLSQHAGVAAEVLEGENTIKDGKMVLPTAVLFNGGVFQAEQLRQRIMDTLSDWCSESAQDAPRMLGHSDLDLAVARGAAYLGLARRGKGVRIRGGSARSYYIGIESAMPAIPGMEPPMKAMCVVPHGMEEGTSTDISGKEIDLCIWTGEPASFRFLSSTTRRHDQPGELFDVEGDDFVEHNAIETVLGSGEGSEGEAVEVDLRAHLTDIGVLELSCVGRNNGQEFKLEFNVRDQGEDQDGSQE